MRESKNDSNEFMKFVEEYEQATIEDLDKLLEHKISGNIQISTTLFTAIVSFTIAAVAIMTPSITQSIPYGNLLVYVIPAMLIYIIVKLRQEFNKPKKLNLEVIKTIFERYHEAKERLLQEYEYNVISYNELEQHLRCGWTIVAPLDNDRFSIRRRKPSQKSSNQNA